MIKPWIIKVSAPLASDASNRYGAYSEEDPSNYIEDDLWCQLVEDCWTAYGYIFTHEIDDSEDLDEDEYNEEYDEIYEQFRQDVEITAEPDEYNEIDQYEIIYDEREDTD